MNDNKLKEAFDQVHAGEELKNKTKAFLAQKTRKYAKTKIINYRRLASAVACLLLILAGGHWLYFTPTATISIDVNPSVELGINRFDRVISVSSYNEDGQKLLESVDVRFSDYSSAVRQILNSERITDLLSRNEIMTIVVIGPDGEQSLKILSDVESHTAEQNNTYCYCAHAEEVDEAHELGLSYGKYRAYLELQALDVDIKPEEVQNMTMREIQDLIDSLSGGSENTAPSSFHNGNGHNGNGHGHGNGHGNHQN